MATKQSWDETYEILSYYAQSQAITFSEIEFINDYLADRYERYCPEKEIAQLKDFLDLKLAGRWLITMSGHITCAIDGVCYDTFDPSERYIWCIYYVGK